MIQYIYRRTVRQHRKTRCPNAPGGRPAAHAAETNCLSALWSGGAETTLPPKPLTRKVLDVNPFMGTSESNIHHDCYNTDSADAVLPIGICSEVNVAMEKVNPHASSAPPAITMC